MRERIVITGCGAIAPNGTGVESFWNNCLAGVSGISEIKRINTTHLTNKRGGEIHNFDLDLYWQSPRKAVLGRGAQLALAAAVLALQDAQLELQQVQSAKTGVMIGTTMGESQIGENFHDHINQGQSWTEYNPRMNRLPVNMMPATVASELGLSGPISLIPTACAAGNYAIGYAMNALLSGKADYMLAGGADPWSRIAYSGFNSMMAITPDVCRPFDKNRQGILISEGAGILLLETETAARRRGARIYAELAGVGIASDGYHMTSPHPEGRGGLLAGQRALRHARLNASDIDYVSAHGTGTPANDRIETTLLKNLLGDHALRCPVSSIKSMIGHTMGAASALESIVCSMAVYQGRVPPTINYQTPDPECDLDIVANTSRELNLRAVMNNSFAFGGNCATLIFKRYGD